jgi:ABC-2 type transport system permease protein
MPPRWRSALTDSLTMTGRSLRLSRRNLEAILTSLLLLMLLFVYLFGGAIQTGTEYVSYVVPGVLLLCAAVVAGHVAASMARNAVSTVLVFGVAFLIGFRPSAGPLDWLAAAGVLLLFIGAISWLAAAVGLLARSPEAAGGFVFLVSFLPYPSSAFVPVETMPTWLHGVATNQPVTPVIETLRGLLLGLPVGTSPARRWPGAWASWSTSCA